MIFIFLGVDTNFTGSEVQQLISNCKKVRLFSVFNIILWK